MNLDMKTIKSKDTKEQYEKIVKLVKKAEKTAQEFIKANKNLDLHLKVKYS